ncbi:MAG: hypothetical protein J6S53_06155, partial [Lentisphaeria bacterium]|nr:hypothetical protein [Lentisphaeria bacterium]
EYTGKVLTGKTARCPDRKNGKEAVYEIDADKSWGICHDEEYLYVTLYGMSNLVCSFALETQRLWSPYQCLFDSAGMDRIVYHGPTVTQTEYTRENGNIKIKIPVKEFASFVRKGFPMRVNVSGEDFSWAGNSPWPGRLLHGAYNPACTGWLVME